MRCGTTAVFRFSHSAWAAPALLRRYRLESAFAPRVPARAVVNLVFHGGSDMKLRVVEIASNLMVKNDALAAKLRDRFATAGTLVVNMLSSPGSGKTTLLEETLKRLSGDYRVAALVGDQATANDADRLSRSGAPVHQITTGAECRLDAQMISKALSEWSDRHFDAIFIENVGNLICPAEYDLGEDLRVVLFSVTEGEDKPLKYPLAFNTADLVLVSKHDL